MSQFKSASWITGCGVFQYRFICFHHAIIRYYNFIT